MLKAGQKEVNCTGQFILNDLTHLRIMSDIINLKETFPGREMMNLGVILTCWLQ